jgi:hypothetical protein
MYVEEVVDHQLTHQRRSGPDAVTDLAAHHVTRRLRSRFGNAYVKMPARSGCQVDVSRRLGMARRNSFFAGYAQMQRDAARAQAARLRAEAAAHREAERAHKAYVRAVAAAESWNHRCTRTASRSRSSSPTFLSLGKPY